MRTLLAINFSLHNDAKSSSTERLGVCQLEGRHIVNIVSTEDKLLLRDVRIGVNRR
jgi:hypothetical protein